MIQGESMKKYLLFLPILLSIATVSSQTKTNEKIIFSDNFKTYQNGSDGSPTWHTVKGNWQIIKGKYVQQSNEYDCASMLDIFLNESFEMEVSFEHLEGDPGVGFIFSSRQRDNIDYAQMVRFDGSAILLFGYFQNGEFNGTYSTKSKEIKPNVKHQLILRANRDEDQCTILLDGNEILVGASFKFPSGYVGLQSSGGRVRFHHVKLKRLPMKSVPSDLNWINHFAIISSGKFLVPDEIKGTIRLIDKTGKLVRTIGTPAESKGQLHKPNAVAVIDDSIIIVTDRGSNQLHQFAMSRKWLNSIGWKGSGLGQFNDPVAIATNLNHQIFVVEKNNNRVQVFDSGLHPITQFGMDRLREPFDIAIQDSSIYIMNTGFSQIESYFWNGKQAFWRKSISYGGGEGRGIAVWKDKLFLSVVNEVRAYDTSGILLSTLRGRCIDHVLPQGIYLDDSGNVFIGDYFHGRIFQTDTNLLNPKPIIKYEDSTAIIKWESVEKGLGELIITEPNPHASLQATAPIENNNHERKIHFDKRNNKLHYKFYPSLRTIPEKQAHTTKYPITCPPGRKTKLYAKLPIATLIFTNVVDEKRLPPGLSLPSQISTSEVERIKAQIDDGIRFYWIHSGMKIFLDNETFIINDPLKRSQVYGSEWWYPPLDSVLEKYLRQNGREIKNYSGFLYLTCTQEFDTTHNKFVIAGKGGGFTNGVGTGKGYGISWWEVTKANHNAGNNWLMVHEFNHQLDDIFLASGYPEYWFNHISPAIGTAGKFGEHFDANSYIMHIVPTEDWFDLRFTTLAAARDADEDGIPDNEPRLPLDEVRLGSDSVKADTDGDGVNDMGEIIFSNWIVEGWGETYGGQAILPNLHERDADHDGLEDKEDKYPCYPYKPEIPYGKMKDSRQLAELHDSKINAAITTAWNEDSLYFSITIDKKTTIKIMIDGNADGWFIGHDNYLITMTVDSDSTVKSRSQIFNATGPKQWPFMDKKLSDSIHIFTMLYRDKDKYNLIVRIPKNESLNFSLNGNKNIGLSFGFLCSFDDNTNRYINIFEPNRFFYVRLIK